MKLIKKEIKIALIFIILLIIFPICCLASNTGVITTETVRMRSEPSIESSVITLLSQDYEVEIIEKEDNWYKVKYQEYTGYVSAEFVSVEENNETIKTKDEENNSNTTESINIENLKEINVDKTVNKQTKIYYLPLIHSEVKGIIEKAENVHVIQIVNEWAYVKTSQTNGWIRIESFENNVEENVKQESVTEDNKEQKIEENENITGEESEKDEVISTKKIGYINAENVNFRKSADKTSEIIDALTLNTEVEILSEENGWYKISVNSQIGYVATTLISNEKIESSSRSAEELRENNIDMDKTNSIGDKIVEYAKSFLGYPYVYGGTTPSGFDCSGFVQYVYKHFGYSVSRSSSSQAKDGKEVSLEGLEKGDILIFKAYDDYSRIGHVGLYIGNNQFIHANDEKTGVIITSLSKGKYPERFVCGRRII